jgi:hypothetical protein
MYEEAGEKGAGLERKEERDSKKKKKGGGSVSIVLGQRIEDGDLAPFRALVHGLGQHLGVRPSLLFITQSQSSFSVCFIYVACELLQFKFSAIHVPA